MSAASLEIYDKVIAFVRMRGPVLPAEVAKLINTNILLASALLSDMVSKNKLLISHAKIGSSPVYYLRGQENMLERRLYPGLNGKDKQTYDFLKQNKVLEDSKLDPLTRVSLRALKDFAVPIMIPDEKSSEPGKQVDKVFWRWHLLPEAEAQELIEHILRPAKPRHPEKKIPKRILEKPAEKITERYIEKPISVSGEKKEMLSEFIEEKMAEKGIKLIASAPKMPKQAAQSTLSVSAAGEKIKTTEPLSLESLKAEIKDVFFQNVIEFFEKNNIEVIEKNVQKKTEYDFIVRIPSNVGTLEYFCTARKKSSITDADLSAAYVRGQMRKLPILYLTSGKLTKKAKEILSKEFKNMTVKSI